MKKLIVLSMMMFAVVALNAQNTNQEAVVDENPNGPVIDFEKTVHNYGTIYQNSDGTCYFVFTNTGKEPLIIDRPRSSCGCTVPTWPKKPILPGKSDTIKVTYDTRRIGRIHKTVSIGSNAKNGKQILTIKGNVKSQPKEELPEKNLDSKASPVNR